MARRMQAWFDEQHDCKLGTAGRPICAKLTGENDSKKNDSVLRKCHDVSLSDMSLNTKYYTDGQFLKNTKFKPELSLKTV
jgi:hypothetical protein